MKIAVIALAVAAFLLLTALILLILLRNRRVKKLAGNVEACLRTGKMTPYCLRDDWLAPLQNEISDLENRLALEKQHTAETLSQSAAFVSDVSHQLKTPLAGIRLYCEMRAAEDPTPYTEKELALIDKTERLIAGLLRYQRLQTEGVRFVFAPHSLAQIVREQVSELRPLFGEKRFSLTGDVVLRCDRQWLGEAVGNVLKNACEHTAPDGSVDVRISEAEGFINLRISDDGGGVPEAQLPMLFQRFYKAETAAPGSTGLGLAITKAVVEKHHGSVAAENGEKGLVVTLCLPQVEGNRKI